MYQVIEYNDYRKENYIQLHGVTTDLEKGRQKVKEILEKYSQRRSPSSEEGFLCQIYELPSDHCNEYVSLSNKKDIISQSSYRFIDFSPLLHKTIRELYEILDEKVPKSISQSISPDEIITKDVFLRLLEQKKFTNYLDFLQEDIGDISIDNTSTVIAIVKCEEF